MTWRLLPLLILFLFWSNSNATEIVLATGEWPPYCFERATNKGAFIEIIEAMAKEANIKIKIEFHPWRRVEYMTKKGEVFAAFPYIKNPEREALYLFSEPIMQSKGVLFYYEPAKKVFIKKWQTYKDLKPYTLGGVIGYWYEKGFKEAALNVEYSLNEELNFKKLKNGDIDLVPTDKHLGNYLISSLYKEDADKFYILENPLNISDLHLMTSNNDTDSNKYLLRMNQALKTIKRNGIYQQILKKYNLTE